MTNYDEMPAGREMDALVAEKVMGLYKYMETACEGPGLYEVWRDAHGMLAQCFQPPRYSTDIAAAWEVMEKLRNSWFVVVRDYGWFGWRVELAQEISDAPGWDLHGCGDTFHLAICRAALKAAGA